MSPISYTTHERLLTVDINHLSFGPKQVLYDIHFKIDNIHRDGVQQGQVVGILGPSGCGKTQLFKCISGLQQSATVDGKVTLNNHDRPPEPGEVGVVFQSYPLLAHRTVWDNIRLAAHGDDQKLIHAKELASAFNISERLAAYPSELSGGQRQRAAIIQQLICSSHFLLLDEPFTGLDPRAKLKACDLLRAVSLTNELSTQIVVTHDIDCAVELCDHLIILGKQENRPGSTLIVEMDLIARGLAWQPNVRKLPEFRQTVDEIVDMFGKL